jgi:mobilization protein MobC
MSCTEVLKARVSPETKLQANALAERELLTEAAWLKRLVVREIRACRESADDRTSARRSEAARCADRQPGGACGKPLFVRLRREDRLLLDARAEARGLRPATYATVLLRAHLRELTPLPKEELLALKRCISELAAIGRNINQIAKAANEGGRLPATVRDEFRAMFKICEALRDNTKALLKANETSWSTGHAEAPL